MIWTVNPGFCQDYCFIWRICPSLTAAHYIVRIFQSEHKRMIQLQEKTCDNLKTKPFDKNDWDTLISFIKDYDFTDRSSNIIAGPITRKYFDYKLLSDSTWIVADNDTIRKEYLDLKYKYDQDLRKYYVETQRMTAYTDGTIYEGEFITPIEEKRFSIYCARLTEKDHVLNDMIYKFVVKYFNKSRYKYLGKMIENDKPKSAIQ
jgi:hypothetical protein